MAHTFTSLRYTVERLQEAEHSLARLTEADYHKFQFELNAFLSAGRSVTFVLQKSFAHVPKFADWYSLRTDEMKTDRVMRFFLELRNISQKQGPVSFDPANYLDTPEAIAIYKTEAIETGDPAFIADALDIASRAEHINESADRT